MGGRLKPKTAFFALLIFCTLALPLFQNCAPGPNSLTLEGQEKQSLGGSGDPYEGDVPLVRVCDIPASAMMAYSHFEILLTPGRGQMRLSIHDAALHLLYDGAATPLDQAVAVNWPVDANLVITSFERHGQPFELRVTYQRAGVPAQLTAPCR